jgi:NAD(P)-dependent dehydrogenase (short-subunit alcohol dehydrogenase family)
MSPLHGVNASASALYKKLQSWPRAGACSGRSNSFAACRAGLPAPHAAATFSIIQQYLRGEIMGDRLKGKVAIITGAGTGIGAATAKRFAEEGAAVVLCGRRPEPLQAVAAEIVAAGGRATAAPLDVADEEAFTRVIRDTAAQHGRLDVLVNNAVVAGGGPIASMSTEAWRGNFTATLDGTFFGVRAALPIMSKQQGGSIVNVASVCGLLGSPGTAGYSAAKAAVINFTRVAALEGARSNVRVNVVAPGAVFTPSFESSVPAGKAREMTAAGIPLGRVADPLELANAILFLACEESSFITGTTLVVDGGKTCELSLATSLGKMAV